MQIEGVERQPHDVVVAAVYGGDARAAYPFLYAVGAGLVERVEVMYIEVYLAVGEGPESDVGCL